MLTLENAAHPASGAAGHFLLDGGGAVGSGIVGQLIPLALDAGGFLDQLHRIILGAGVGDIHFRVVLAAYGIGGAGARSSERRHMYEIPVGAEVARCFGILHRSRAEVAVADQVSRAVRLLRAVGSDPP